MNTLEKLQYDIGQWYENSSICQFMRWWTSELKSFVPDKYQEKLFPQSIKVYLLQNQKAVEVWCLKDKKFEQHLSSNEEESWWHQLQHIVNQADGQKMEVKFLLPNTSALIRKIALPRAAMENLDEVIGFELDKYVPFNRDQVQLAYKIDKDNSNDEKILLDLVVMPKGEVQNVLNLCDEKSVTLDAIDVNGINNSKSPQHVGVNLLPIDKRKPFDTFNLKLNIGLFLLLFALIYFVMHTSITNKQDKVDRLTEINMQLQKQARTAKLLRKDLKTTIVSSKFLQIKKSERPALAFILSDLTQKLPDDTYVTRFKINSERLEITGESDNASSLVPKLDESSYWYIPQIAGGVTHNPRTNKQKFTIKADLQEPKETEDEDDSNS